MTNDGGPAFPVVVEGGPDSGLYAACFEGMTLRDWFAGQALVGMLCQQNVPVGPEMFADRAFDLADAMLLERERKDST